MVGLDELINFVGSESPTKGSAFFKRVFLAMVSRI